MLDLHCHILPEVDDGSHCMATSLQMAKLLVEAGFQGVAPSPHSGIGPGGDVSIARACAKRKELKERLAKEEISLELYPNAEHHVSPELFQKIALGEVVPIGGKGSWLLVELPWSYLSQVEHAMFRLQALGFKVLLAHPERYQYLETGMVERLVQRGVKLQLELGSFISIYGKRAHKKARFFAEQGWAHVVATDLHRPEPWLGLAIGEVARLYGQDALDKATHVNPVLIVGDAKPDKVDSFVT